VLSTAHDDSKKGRPEHGTEEGLKSVVSELHGCLLQVLKQYNSSNRETDARSSQRMLDKLAAEVVRTQALRLATATTHPPHHRLEGARNPIALKSIDESLGMFEKLLRRCTGHRFN